MTDDLRIVVDQQAAEPPFEQVRALAADLGLAVNTVARAYKELEAAGLVQTRRRAGTTVASGHHQADVAVSSFATKFAVLAREAGMDDAAAIDLVRNALRSIDRQG